MIETIKEFIVQYLPSITSIGGVVIAIVTFFANIKKILEKKDSESSALKTQLIDLNALFKEVTTKCTSNQETLSSELIEALKNNDSLKEEVELLKEQASQLKELANDNQKLKNQLQEILRRGE